MTLAERWADIEIKQGARAPEVTTQLYDGFGNPWPLPDGATVIFRMRSTNPTVVGWEVNAEAEIVPEDRSVIRYIWTPTDTDTPGKYYGEFVVTLIDGREIIEPSGPTYYHIEVGRALASDMSEGT